MQRKIKYLTFVIICYNKDYQNALKNIHSILKSHIPFEYEILAVYNRSGNIQQEAESEFFEEIKKLKNTRSLLVTDAKNQYFCRSSAIKSINSKYTWFIDGDDSILKIPRKFKNLDYDVVSPNVLLEEEVVSDDVIKLKFKILDTSIAYNKKNYLLDVSNIKGRKIIDITADTSDVSGGKNTIYIKFNDIFILDDY